ncbi:MAG: hypothetical protein ACLSHC_02290 [Bilophila wadsworthia]
MFLRAPCAASRWVRGQPWRVPSRHTVKDGLSTWETMEKRCGLEACSTGCAQRGLPGRCGGGTFEGTGAPRVYLSWAGSGMGHPCPANGISDLPWGPPRPGKGLIGLADGAARRSQWEAVRTGRPRGRGRCRR